MSIKDKLDEDPEKIEGWRPEPNDELIGRVVRINERSTDDYPEPYPVITVQQADGTRLAFHAFHTVAKTAIAEQGAKVGDEIGIRYLGKEPGKQFDYHNYRIVVEPTGSPIGRSSEDAAADEAIAATQEAQPTDEDKIPF